MRPVDLQTVVGRVAEATRAGRVEEYEQGKAALQTAQTAREASRRVREEVRRPGHAEQGRVRLGEEGRRRGRDARGRRDRGGKPGEGAGRPGGGPGHAGVAAGRAARGQPADPGEADRDGPGETRGRMLDIRV